MVLSLNHIRAEVLALPLSEQLDYALGLLDFYLDPVPAFTQGCGALGLGFSVRDIRMLLALDRRRGQWVSADALQGAAMVDCSSDDWGTLCTVYKRVGSMRRAFDKSKFPVNISQWNGVGYRMCAPSEFCFEALAGGSFHA